MEVFGDKLHQKNSKLFACENCDFNCSKKGDWNRHLMTSKHTKLSLANANGDANYILQTYLCNHCNKQYESRNGLWKHNKQCICKKNTIIEQKNYQTQITPELVIQLIEQNKELQQTLIDQNKTIMELAQKSGTNNSYNNNKTFNLQVFLNETCKDAINLTDFVNQLQVSVNELEDTGNLGYAEGISKVFIKNLNGIDFTQRPIHCSDSKRETLYIKDDNQWLKDDDNKTVLTKAIKQVANKNIKQISEWQKLYPKYSDPDSKQNDKYMKIVLNSMSGSTKEESDKNYEKIARNITKEVVIEKSLP